MAAEILLCRLGYQYLRITTPKLPPWLSSGNGQHKGRQGGLDLPPAHQRMVQSCSRDSARKRATAGARKYAPSRRCRLLQIDFKMSTLQGPRSYVGCDLLSLVVVVKLFSTLLVNRGPFFGPSILKLDARCLWMTRFLWLFRRIPVGSVDVAAVDMLRGSARVW